jgi:osmotically inducible protein OsmC
MPLATRDATVTWSGTLADGHGALTTGGGAEQQLPMDWASRSEQADGTTSPEELLAASLAGCYAMQLALELQANGTPAERLHVHATCTLDGDAARHEYAISALELEVDADVPDLADGELGRIAREADAKCPVANAVRGNVEVRSNL